MSQRNRSGRAPNRNNGGAHGEEVQYWETFKERLPDTLAMINEDTENLNEFIKLDAEAAEYSKKGKEPPASLLAKMEAHCRKGVKSTDTIKQELASLTDKLKVVRAVVQGPKDQDGDAGSGLGSMARSAASSRPSRDRDRDTTATSSVYDLDAAGESPVRSPIGGSSRRFDRSGNRDSMPPHSDSGEPPAGTSAGGGAAQNQIKSKVTFSKGDAVAFRSKQVNASEPVDWILGEVAAVIGDGKTRRYKVMDIEPEDSSKQREFRTSASNMIPITPESQAGSLPPWEAGTTVLALYPNTTTFYRAEVMSTEDGKVNLRFEGESDSATLQKVERRFVVEYRP
ncbi:hypothetical protein VUR80DRAFT_9801 [Thermomyces stellatus]